MYPSRSELAEDHPAGSSRALGFSLVEAMVTLALTAVLMIMSWQIFFAMKRSSDQMWLNTEPRQIARRASEYVGSYIRAASDMNPDRNNPAAIMAWWQDGDSTGGTLHQSCWNNVTDANLADVGTDIITVGHPTSAIDVAVDSWPGYQHASTAHWYFIAGCDGSANESQRNIDLFKQLTGAYINDAGKEVSPPLLLVDEDGSYGFYMITDYKDSVNADCCTTTTPAPGLKVVANPGQSDQVNPPSGQPSLSDPQMRLGLRWVTFRVRNGWLEQKNGLFDPVQDNPGTAFVPLLPDIEDMQVAWIYRDGTVWNTASQQLPTGTYTANVPTQDTTNNYDVINVVGIRLTVTARSSTDASWEEVERFQRPSVEDRPVGAPDRFYHESSTITAMIRNRLLER
jgi:type II secretory pathway component PulJ